MKINPQAEPKVSEKNVIDIQAFAPEKFGRSPDVDNDLRDAMMELNPVQKAGLFECKQQTERNRVERYPMVHGQVIELASFAIPARWRSSRSEADRSAVEHDFHNEIHIALRPFVEQLPLGAALVVEHDLAPAGNGAMTLRSRLFSSCPEGGAGLDQELAICLSTLSEHFSFRSIDQEADATPEIFGKTVFIRPLAVVCSSKAGAIGFTSANNDQPVICLPILEYSKGQREGHYGPQWSSSLRHVIKAARAARQSIRIRIRVIRERLDPKVGEMLQRLLKSDLNTKVVEGEHFDDGKEGGFPARSTSSAVLNGLIAAWANTTPDVMRIELEAETGLNQPVSESLLRILAGEIFPGQAVEILEADAANSSVQGAKQLIDFSNLYPLVAGLPPLLPQPTVLESLNFTRHYSNPSVHLPSDGLLLGRAHLSGFEHPVHFGESDRSRHMYILGATGTGKSTLLYNLIRQDMDAGRGVAMIDPHGDLFEQVLAAVPPERVRDVVIIDPSDVGHPVSLNPLDFGAKPSLMKVNRLINDLLDIFSEIYNMREAGGPGFELYFRNSFLLASIAGVEFNHPELPNGPPTMLTVLEVLRDSDFREYLLSKVGEKNLGVDIGREVVAFFKSAHASSGEQAFPNWVPYISSKLSRFINNPQLRQLLCTPKRTVDFRRIMDEKKILLVNLNKGQLGDQNTRMIGMLITKYLFQAALSRSDVPREARTPFYYYLDEFQNFVTSDVPDMLAESRKFGLHLVLAHQTLGQLSDEGSHKTLDAVLGNVATKLIFRVGLKESEKLEPNFLPYFDAHTLAQLPDRQVLARMLVDNKPSLPFVFETLSPKFLATAGAEMDVTAEARRLSRQTYSVVSPDAQEQPPVTTTDVKCDKSSSESIIPLLNGALGVRCDSETQVKGASKLLATTDDSLNHWQSLPRQRQSAAFEVSKGAFYRTKNNSLVLICKIDSDKDSCALVIMGGHGDESLPGNKPGSCYWLNSEGEFRGEHPAKVLLGMGLWDQSNIRLFDSEALNTSIDQNFCWLLGRTRSKATKISAGFYRTLNNSVVFVTESNDKYGWQATVCQGGHGLKSLSGEKLGEHYSLMSLDGQFVIRFGKASDLPSTTLAVASGMTLAERLPLVGDLPSDLADASLATPTKRKNHKASS